MISVEELAKQFCLLLGFATIWVTCCFKVFECHSEDVECRLAKRGASC